RLCQDAARLQAADVVVVDVRGGRAVPLLDHRNAAGVGAETRDRVVLHRGVGRGDIEVLDVDHVQTIQRACSGAETGEAGDGGGDQGAVRGGDVDRGAEVAVVVAGGAVDRGEQRAAAVRRQLDAVALVVVEVVAAGRVDGQVGAVIRRDRDGIATERSGRRVQRGVADRERAGRRSVVDDNEVDGRRADNAAVAHLIVRGKEVGDEGSVLVW